MKKNMILLCVMMVAMMVASVGLTSCSDEGIAGEMTEYIVGTWKCNQYYLGDNYREKIYIRNGDGCVPTTVTLNANGKCSGNGMIINGQGTFTVKTGNRWNDGYYAILTFMQEGNVTSTVTVKSYTNDHLTGEAQLSGYDGKTFIFTKQ